MNTAYGFDQHLPRPISKTRLKLWHWALNDEILSATPNPSSWRMINKWGGNYGSAVQPFHFPRLADIVKAYERRNFVQYFLLLVIDLLWIFSGSQYNIIIKWYFQFQYPIVYVHNQWFDFYSDLSDCLFKEWTASGNNRQMSLPTEDLFQRQAEGDHEFVSTGSGLHGGNSASISYLDQRKARKH